MDLSRGQDGGYRDTDPAPSVPIHLPLKQFPCYISYARFLHMIFLWAKRVMLKRVWKLLFLFHPFISQISWLRCIEFMCLTTDYRTSWFHSCIYLYYTIAHFPFIPPVAALTNRWVVWWLSGYICRRCVSLRDPLSVFFKEARKKKVGV